MTASTLSHFRQFHQPYLQALAETGAQVDLACPNPEILEGVHEVIHVPLEKTMASWKNLKATHILRKRMKEKNYDTVICHTALASFFTRLGCLFWKKKPKVICVVHGYLFHAHGHWLKNFIYLAAEKLVASKTDLVLTMNHWDNQQAEKFHLGKEIATIPGMGITIPTSERTCPQTIVEIMKEDPHAFLLVYGGELSKRKNQSFLIHAMKELPSHVHLLLCGDGAEKAHYEAIISNHALSSRVHLLGHVEDLRAFYSYAHVVVSSSISEGLPFHVMEAMSLGKVCLLSEIKGHEDLIQHGKEGFLFPLGDQKNFLQLVQTLEESKVLQTQLGERGRTYIEAYHIQSVMSQILPWYLGLAP